MIYRVLEQSLKKHMDDKKVIVILGPRQVGKTTLLKSYFEGKNHLQLNGDDSNTRELLAIESASMLERAIGGNEIVVIDEAQRIENIGLKVKLIHDQLGRKVVLTGSSSLEIANKTKEPLTGRKWEYFLYPLWYGEMVDHHGFLEEKGLLEHRMVYGYYPEVVTSMEGSEIEILNQLSDSYLYKDVLQLDQINKPAKITELIRALAFQVGSEVSYHELSQLIGLHPETVEHYIDLLEKLFVIFKLPSLSRNLRNEIKKGKKYYFYDLGIRNAVINNYKPLSLRNDVGALWENFLIVERMKYKAYNQIYSNDFFWRTHAQQEIDFVEEREGKFFTYEFKWNPKKKAKLSKSFTNAYPEHEFEVIHRDNYYDFILGRQND